MVLRRILPEPGIAIDQRPAHGGHTGLSGPCQVRAIGVARRQRRRAGHYLLLLAQEQNAKQTLLRGPPRPPARGFE